MEDRVRSLEIANAELATNITHLTATVKELSATVQDLRDTMNKGRGALWLALLAAGTIASIITTFAKKFLGIV